MKKITLTITLFFLFFAQVVLGQQNTVVIQPAIKVTKTYSGPTMSYTNTPGTLVGAVNFTSTDIPVGLILKDVEVTINWTKSDDGSCTTTTGIPADFSHVGFGIRSPAVSTKYLAASAATAPFVSTTSSWSGTSGGSFKTTFTANPYGKKLLPSSTPVNGVHQTNGDDLSDFNGTTAIGNWSVVAIDDAPVVGPALCINSYSITLSLVESRDSFTLSYPQETYAKNDSDPTPLINVSTEVGSSFIGGVFYEASGDLSIDNETGIVDVSNSPTGRYTIQYFDKGLMSSFILNITTAIEEIKLPLFENSTPTSSSITATGFTLNTDVDKAGVIYYAILADGATAPTVAEVKAGTGNGGSSVITSGNATVNTGDFTNDFNVIGLTEGTAYDVYVVAEDDEGTPNLQANPTKTEVTTLTLAPTNNILYVNKNVSDGNSSGNSWANAIPELADALVWANKNKANFTTAPLQIWVAGGTYKPMYSPEDGSNFGTDQARDNSFLMVNNVQLYGGFAGTETTLIERDLTITANKTTLSGDFGTEDVVTGSGSTLSITENDSNAAHVIVSAGDVGTALLDGFTISGGNANLTGNTLTVNGINTLLYAGGGMLNYSSSPKIKNTNFIANVCDLGAGMYSQLSSPNISNSTFSRNSGSGMYNENSSPNITNTAFIGNNSPDGGGIYNTDSSSPTITNSIFSKNAAFRGGGAFNELYSSPIIINTTFSENNATYGDGLYNDGASNPKIYNSIVWGDIENYSSSPEIKNSIIKGNSDITNGNIDATNLSDRAIFKDPANGDYSLNGFGPALNAGDNTLYTGTIATDKDLAGNARLFAGIPDPDVIDLGAYEYQAEPLKITATNSVLYVNKTATGNKTGDSWANAIPELADALVWANNNKVDFTTTPLQIWVAGGTYKPMYSPEDGSNFGTDQTRENAFLMVNNVQLYGGFAGTETTLVERDLTLTANKTLLSGDYNDDDTVSGSGNSIDNNGENANHVIISNGTVGAALLDGFTITAGKAEYSGSGNTQISVNNVDVSYDSGAGMSINQSAPTVTNCTFSQNTASSGGGISINNNSSPIVTNCTFSQNTASSGGGMSIYNNSSPIVRNTIFNKNYASVRGGALNIFLSNTNIINSTINGNIAANGGNGIYTYSSTSTLSNSILFGDVLNQSSDAPVLKNSLGEGILYDASGVATSTTTSDTNLFNDPANGDYSLKAGSIAINAGNNTLYTDAGGNLTTDKDLAGNPRVFQSTIDIGAYESQTLIVTPDANNILYVNKSATGNKTGDSWVNAIPELADALLWANKNKANFTTTPLQIWVAGGTYKPMYSPEDGSNFGTNQARDNSFLMVNNVQLYGGFAGTEATLADRDLSVTANKTTLSGDFETEDVISGSGNTLSITENDTNAYHVVISTGNVGTARLDGFTISGGNADSYGSAIIKGELVFQYSGGGMLNINSSPSIRNSTFFGNTADSGGGMYNDSSSPSIIKSTFNSNTSTAFGAGMYNYSSSPNISNSIFSRNNSDNNGGGMVNYNNSSPSLRNSVFSENKALLGAEIYNNFSSNPEIYNNIVWGDIQNLSSIPEIKNSIVKGNSDTTNGNIDATNLTATDIFNDPANGDYMLNKYSPAINAGDNTLYTGTIATDKDLAGKARLFDGLPTNDKIDIGAYEYQGEPLKITPTDNIVYVKKNVSGSNNSGSSWENAVSELADALVWAKEKATTSIQIWVAGGTYKPMYSPEDGKGFADDGRNNTFSLVNDIQVYGGFAGTEAKLENRNLRVTANTTILSGDIGAVDDNTDNAYHVVVSAGNLNTARLDGFTITGGYANSTGTYKVNTKDAYSCSGAGIYNSESNPFYKNLIIKENSCSESGGGMFSYSSTPNLQNVAIENNQAKDGGGMANQYYSYATLLNVFIKNNNASLYGNGLYNVDQSNATLTNSSIVGNKATIDNETVVVPAGCASQNSSVTLKNSIVWDDITGDFTAQYSLIKDKSNTDNGNIDAADLTDIDLFIDPSNGDYSLKSTSPALNAGSNALYTGAEGKLTDKDLAGNARIFDGSPSTDVIDMGAYELQENPFIPAPTITYATQVYAGNDKTVEKLQVTGTAIIWYDEATDGSVVATTANLVDGTTYYASQTLDEVESTERVAITVRRISDANQNRLAGSTVADLVSTPATGTTVAWFIEATGGTALNSTDLLSAGTYYVEQNSAGVLSNRVAVTVDLAPSVTTLSPADDAAGVTVASNLVITFDENIAKGTGYITIYNAADDYAVETINVLATNVTVADAIVTINTSYDFDKSKTYYVQIDATAFTDVAGNSFAGILDDTTWNFATELNLAPTAIALSNSNIDENALANSVVGSLSSTDADSHAFTYTLVSGTGDTDNASFSISGSDLTINTSPDFETKSSYTVRVRTSDGSLTFEKEFTITVNNVNEAATVIAITVTATPSQTKVYGQNDPVFTYTVSPALLSGDTFTGTLARVAGENVGTYAIAQGTLSAGANYVINFVPANYTITKADQVITWNQTLVSDCGSSAPIALTATSTSGLAVNYSSSNSTIATILNSELVFANFGSVTVTATQAGDNNYNAALSIVLPIVNSQPNLISKHFDNVIFFDNSSNEFVAYTWYKNGVVVAGQRAQYFKETGALNGTYYAVATKKDGTLISTCPLVLSSTGVVEIITIAPNPVRSNSVYQLITNVDSARLQNARVTVFNILGTLIMDSVIDKNAVEMVAPSVEGIYIVKMTLASGKYFTKNLLVKN